jgi:hypothetical protein
MIAEYDDVVVKRTVEQTENKTPKINLYQRAPVRRIKVYRCFISLEHEFPLRKLESQSLLLPLIQDLAWH